LAWGHQPLSDDGVAADMWKSVHGRSIMARYILPGRNSLSACTWTVVMKYEFDAI
jgi:hypothetical protein